MKGPTEWLTTNVPEIEEAAEDCRQFGGNVESLQADLATIEGVDRAL